MEAGTLRPVRETVRILLAGNPLLAVHSSAVEEFDEEVTGYLKVLIPRMVSVMAGREARGLAAVQIGVPLRVIVATADLAIRYMVNPVVTRTLKREKVEMEGCLSVPPHLWREVSRPAKCDIAWQDVEGNHLAGSFAGDWARVLQHEIDHLDGVLITDKAPV